MSIQGASTNISVIAFFTYAGRFFPLKLKYWFSRIVADWVSGRRASPLVRAVYLNQAVIRNERSSEKLNLAVRDVFRHAARCFSDFSHCFHDPEKIRSLFVDSPEIQGMIRRSHKRDRGLFVVAPHLSNFDLTMLTLGYQGLDAQVLSLSNPGAGFEFQNMLREKSGLDVTPISERSLIKALGRLKRGGTVATGIDRPVDNKEEHVLFFNRPAPLPVGHVRLALKADAEVIVAAPRMNSMGKYEISVSDPMEMERYADPREEVKRNAEAILKVIEKHIRRAPEQWLMYYPVWPNIKMPDGTR